MNNLIFSEEDIHVTTIKASLYFFKVISLKVTNYRILIKPVIRLVLVTTSRFFSINGVSENRLNEVENNVTSCLKDTLTKITVTITTRSVFNVKHKDQGQAEMQVRNLVIVLFTITVILNFVFFIVLDQTF